MKDVKYILNDNDLYDYHRLQEKLTRFAADGWHLEKISNIFWKFRRGEKKQVRYEIIYAASASAYNSRPTEDEEALAELCAEAGWKLAASWAQVQVYRNEDPNAIPLETDEVEKYRNIRRNMMLHLIPQQLLTILLFAVQFLLFGSLLLERPAAVLSSSMIVLTLAAIAGILIEFLIQLAATLLWLRRAGRAVEAGQSILPNRFYQSFRWVMRVNGAIIILCLMFLLEPVFVLAVLVVTVIAVLCSLGTLAITKRLGASRKVNFWAPVVVAMAVILASRPLLSPILTPEEPPEVDFPLTLAQLTGAKNSERLTIDVDSSPLVSHGRYYDFGGTDQIQYTLVDIHCPLFYDMILNDMEQTYIQTRDYHGDAILSEELRELIGADYVRRSTGYLSTDRWFICWDDRIVRLYADWVLTEDQISTVVELLKP